MYFNNHFSNDSQNTSQKKIRRTGPLQAVPAALILALALMTGCSGTGTMYTPDSFEEEADTASTEASAAAAVDAADFASTGAEFAAEEEAGSAGHSHSHKKKHSRGTDSDEEPRTLRAELEGTGSDLYTANAVNSYYSFTLDDVSFRLPCAFADFVNAGWELADAGNENAGEQTLMVPSLSFEYFDAVPAGSTASTEKVRLCLANFTENDLAPASCTVCGIQVSHGSSAALKTTFGVGIGDSLQSLTSVFGTDPSCYQQTRYSDGICTVRYHFSNGLNENETIPVLAEAEDKSVAELLMAETTEDGNTIRSLSLCYFRLPE